MSRILLLLLLLVTGRCHFTATYIGCFVDSGTRDLTGLLHVRRMGQFDISSSDGVYRPSSLTLDICVSVCSVGRFRYLGLQATNDCFCSDSYGSQGSASESDCNMACTGDSSRMCGGAYRNSVYAIEYTDSGRFEQMTSPMAEVTDSYSQMLHWTVQADSELECVYECSASVECSAAMHATDSCHLLRLPINATSLTSTTKEEVTVWRRVD